MISPAVKAVFFDLDDTLCAYWDAAKHGLRATFESANIPNVSPEQLMEAWVIEFRQFCPHLAAQGWKDRYLQHGETTRTELMRRTLSLVGMESIPIAAKLSETYGAERNNALQLFPDAAHLLDRLQGHVPLGIMTNGPADIQRQELQTLGIESQFQCFLIEGELGFGKPDPLVFDRAEQFAGASGSEIVMIGNSFAHDIIPAIERGWQTAWVRRPSDVPPSAKKESSPEPIPTEGPEPTLIVGSLDEIPVTL